MAANPVIFPKFRAFDSNGDPLAGGLLYSYAAGTSTPLATYTTRAGTVANANPVVLDANGEARVWLTAGVDYKLELRNSLGVVQWTEDNIPSSAESASSTSDAAGVNPGGRLTLTSADAVTASDVTGATTVYYSPQSHNKVPLYDGGTWALQSISSELSQTTADATKSPAAVAANSNYDLFIWLDSATLRLSRGPAWSSDTSRGTGAGTTELERKDGRYVNKQAISNGPAAQRGLYVGTIRSDGSAQINDSLAKRHVWNMYNRMLRPMRVTEATNAWTYNSGTIRQANASTANQLAFVRGLNDDAVRVRAVGAANVTGPVADGSICTLIGLDSTTAIATGCVNGMVNLAIGAATTAATMVADWVGFPGFGSHYLAWLERSNASDTVSWKGDQNIPDRVQTGITGELLA